MKVPEQHEQFLKSRTFSFHIHEHFFIVVKVYECTRTFFDIHEWRRHIFPYHERRGHIFKVHEFEFFMSLEKGSQV